MTDISRRRTGELLKAVFQVLWDKPEGMQAIEVLKSIPPITSLTEYEKGSYASASNVPRYHKIVRFGTLVLVKAGWMVKAKGRWLLTEEGKSAFKKYPDPEGFYKEAVRLYYVWKRSLPEAAEPETVSPGEVAEKPAITFEEAEEKAWEQIQAFMKSMNPYDFQDLVADLLRAMGYHISWIAPPGKDRGVDIIAHNDPLGTRIPRLKVQVKRREETTKAEGLRSFLSVLGTNDGYSGETGHSFRFKAATDRSEATLDGHYTSLWPE